MCALLAEYPNARGVGLDQNPAAVRLAGRNLARCGFSARGRACEGDWTAPGIAEWIGAPFDLVVSNPPYIPDADRGLLPADVDGKTKPRNDAKVTIVGTMDDNHYGSKDDRALPLMLAFAPTMRSSARTASTPSPPATP